MQALTSSFVEKRSELPGKLTFGIKVMEFASDDFPLSIGGIFRFQPFHFHGCHRKMEPRNPEDDFWQCKKEMIF